MPRPRSNVLKVGDKVSHKSKEGVIVFVEPGNPLLYSVHFYPQGRGLYKINELQKIRPSLKFEELMDEDMTSISEKELVDA
jgi:hypothetical protein